MENTFHPPAICPNGHISKGGIGLGPGNTGAHIYYNATNCPECPETARIFDGVYDTVLKDDGRLEVHIKALDENQLRRLKDLLSGEIGPEELAELAEAEEDPKIKKILSFSAKYAWRAYRLQQRVERALELLEQLGIDPT